MLHQSAKNASICSVVFEVSVCFGGIIRFECFGALARFGLFDGVFHSDVRFEALTADFGCGEAFRDHRAA